MRKLQIALMITTTVLAHLASVAQPRSDRKFQTILASNHNSYLQEVIANPLTYRCQIIYTQIDRDQNNRPHFKQHFFNYDPQLYFNPASTVKMPLAFLALEKLQELSRFGIDKYTAVQIDSSYPGQQAALKDATAENSLPSIAHYIKKAFLVSDNDAYNRMYQFVGQQEINRKLQAKGFYSTRITRQFMGFTPEQNRHTNAVRFIRNNGVVIYTQPPAYNTDSFHFPSTVRIGKGYLDRNDSLVNEPMDFTMHNNLSLQDLQKMLQAVLFPGSVAPSQGFNISNDDRKFLFRYLSQFPSETNYPKYDSTKYFDSYVKFFFRDSGRKMPDSVRVFNKVGWAYGFMTDVSYVADFANKVEFMLAATIYVNSDGILNDDKYDYETKGYPFLYQLGQTIYRYEVDRKRRHRPDLSDFRVEYEHRDKGDLRPTIGEVEN